ncbi:LysR substrate-binding domain-containing protein [Mesorhizobium sp. KR2-14]|uniref:LysR substrate-binding domain-containing protein n=1 Tax=Mesorhizobium sp. KR2-14 TaxID=3156610 RepID=UPI0032B3609C
MIRYARLIQTDLAHLRDEIVGIMRGQGGRVAAGVIMGAVPLLTGAISALVARQADLSVEIVEDTSAGLLAQLDAGRLDLAICRTTISQAPQFYDSVKLQDETLAVIANVGHPLRHAKKLTLQELAPYRWVVYRANMPMRLLLKREYRDCGIEFPEHLLETTSAFATLALLQANPSFVALVSIEVAQFFAHRQMTRILPLALASRSEAYELVTRKGASSRIAHDKIDDRYISITDILDPGRRNGEIGAGLCYAHLAAHIVRSSGPLRSKFPLSHSLVSANGGFLHEPPRVCRRPFGFSHVAQAGPSSVA